MGGGGEGGKGYIGSKLEKGVKTLVKGGGERDNKEKTTTSEEGAFQLKNAAYLVSTKEKGPGGPEHGASLRNNWVWGGRAVIGGKNGKKRWNPPWSGLTMVARWGMVGDTAGNGNVSSLGEIGWVEGRKKTSLGEVLAKNRKPGL